MTTIPQSIDQLIEARLHWMGLNDYRPAAVKRHHAELKKLQRWCQQRELSQYQQLSPELIESFGRYVSRLNDTSPPKRSQAGQAPRRLSPQACQQTLAVARALLLWAQQRGWLLSNPFENIAAQRLSQRLPPIPLTVAQMETLMQAPNLATPYGLRDRAILETFYATAIRRGELARLHSDDLDRNRRRLWVRQGKGLKDRLIPISRRALAWIERYEQEARPIFLQRAQKQAPLSPTSPSLFLNKYGRALQESGCSARLMLFMPQVFPGKDGACHLLRHSVATALLERGCDIRYIQELLGHEGLETTQLYTQLSPQALKRAYARYHPAMRALRKEDHA